MIKKTILLMLFLFSIVMTVSSGGSSEEKSADSADSAVAQQTNRLTIASAGGPGNLDPIFGGTPITTSIVMAVYETPVGYVTEEREGYMVQVANDINGWKPLLAEEVEISDDRRILTFHLRKGVRFYPSGNEMTAEDWLWSWRRQLSDPPIGWGQFENQQASITSMEQIEQVDTYTVNITLNEPNPRALPFMRFQMFAIYDSQEVQKHTTDQDPWAADWLSKHTVGTGPYYIHQWRSGEKITLKQNPYYWGTPPAYEQVDINIIPEESTRLSLLEQGDVDLVKNVSPELAERFTQKTNIEMLSIPSGNRVYIGFNVNNNPFSNRTLREVVAYATPYDSIRDDIYEGHARRYGSFVLPELDAYTNEGFDYNTDLEKARRLFEQVNNIEETPTLIVNAAEEPEKQTAALLQDYLSRIDVQIDVRPLPSGEFTSKLFSKQLNFFITSGVSWIDDPATIVGLWMVSGAYGNYTGFSNSTVDDIQERWQFQAPSNEREQAYKQAQKLYNQAVNVIYLVLADHLVLLSDNIERYTYYKDTATRYQDLRPKR